MSWYNPFSWGAKDPNQYRVDLSQDPSLEHGNRISQQANQGLNAVNSRQDVQSQDEFRRRQLALADRLGQTLGGARPGAGELAAQREGQRQVAQQIGMANMQRGANAATAARDAARNISAIQGQTAGQAQEAALRDQQMAAGQLAGISAQGRQGDMSTANLALQNRQANDQARLQYLSQLFGVSEAEMRARMAQDQLRVQQELGLANMDTGGWGADLMNLGGQLGAAAITSDRRAKKNIKSADIDEMLDRLRPYSYDYKNPKRDGSGKKYGVMAQDLEKSRAGKEMVKETSHGKVVDYGQGLSTMMASLAELNGRLRKLEGRKG